MTTEPPPIQEKTTEPSGLFPQTWIRWFQGVKSEFNILLEELNSRQDIKYYWFDYNDTATASTRISHTGGATNTYLTNNGAGAFSNSYNPNGFDDVWDVSNNQFDFSSLKIGDTVSIRIDIVVGLSVNNQTSDIVFDMAIGSGSDYQLQIDHFYFKQLGDQNVTVQIDLYIGNAATNNFPAKLKFLSDDDADIQVNGWFVTVTSI